MCECISTPSLCIPQKGGAWGGLGTATLVSTKRAFEGLGAEHASLFGAISAKSCNNPWCEGCCCGRQERRLEGAAFPAWGPGNCQQTRTAPMRDISHPNPVRRRKTASHPSSFVVTSRELRMFNLLSRHSPCNQRLWRQGWHPRSGLIPGNHRPRGMGLLSKPIPIPAALLTRWE